MSDSRRMRTIGEELIRHLDTLELTSEAFEEPIDISIDMIIHTREALKTLMSLAETNPY